MPPLPDLIISLIIILAAALAQGFLGFGFGILAMSSLTLSQDLIHASGVVNITGIVLTGWMTFQLRHHILRKLTLRMLPGVLLGVFLGVTALGRLERDLMVSILGASIAIVAAWNLAQPRLRWRESTWLDTTMALLGGSMSGAFNTGGPPLIIHLYRRPESPDALKATLQILFLAMSLWRLPLAATQGLLDQAIWLNATAAVPAVIIGVASGIALARRVHPDRFRRVAWIGLGLLGIALLFSA